MRNRSLFSKAWLRRGAVLSAATFAACLRLVKAGPFRKAKLPLGKARALQGIIGPRSVVLATGAIVLVLSPLFAVRSFATSLGPYFPTAAVSTGFVSGGVTYQPWSNPTNVYSSDGANASVSIASGSYDAGMTASGFGFNIPTGATINGFQAAIIENAASSSKAKITDKTIQLGISSNTSANMATTATWPSTTNTSVTYGGSTNLWGSSFTVSDINSSSFGLTVSAQNVKLSGAGSSMTANVDSIQLTVYYTLNSTFTQASSRVYANKDATASGSVSFGAVSSLSLTGAQGLDTASADFNGDGKADLAVNTTVSGANDIKVALGNGDGTFGAATGVDSESTTNTQQQLRTADFDGDGRPDLATSYVNTTGYVDVLLNGTTNGSTTPVFTVPDTVSVGTSVNFFAAGDLNGDGKADLAVPNGSNGFTVFLNTTSGGVVSFNGGTVFSTGATSTPGGIFIADFTGDGKADVAVVDSSSARLLLFPGDGAGSFGAMSATTIGQSPTGDIAAGDLNGDGHPDIVTTNTNDSSVLINNGSGSFTVSSIAQSALDVSMAELNGDGKMDVVLADKSTGNFYVYPGDGAGGFGTASSYSGAGGGYNNLNSVSTADFNGDGHADMAGGDSSFTRVDLFLSVVPVTIDVGAPLATQDTAATVPSEGQPFRLRMALKVSSTDLAANGQAFKLQYAPMASTCSATSAYSDVTDTSTVSYYDNPTATNSSTLVSNANDPADGTNTTANGGIILETYQEKGTTTFTNPTAIPSGKDGLWDFALTTKGATGGTHYCMRIVSSAGTPLTTYSTYPELIAPPASYAQAAYRLFANQDGSSSPGGTISFAAKTDYAVNMYAAAAIAADFNGDGKPDLAVANGSSNNISILLNNGSGGFNPKVDYTTGSDTDTLVAADFNGDGAQDLAATNYSSGNVSVLLGTGTGTFGATTNYTVGTNPKYIVSGDFNGDGKKDVAVSNTYDNTVSVLLGTGTGSFGTQTTFATSTGPQGLTTADFNGDGKLDLAVATNSSGLVSVLLGTGTGSFGTKTDFTAGGGAEDVGAADFNKDGKLDLVVANNTANTVSLLLGTGTGSFGAKTDFTAGNGPENTSIADFNGDKIPDVAMGNVNGGNVTILPGNGTGGFGTMVSLTTTSTPEITGVGDFNGDGKPDIASPDYVNNTVSVLLNTTAFPSSIDVGAPLAAQNTAATMATYGQPFRLRLDVAASASGVGVSGQVFKLQYAPRGTTCSATSAASYVDVTDTTPIGYYDNPIATNGTSFATNSGDPTDGSNTLVRQTYQEKGTTTFSNTTGFTAGQDGMWDFALTSNASANNAAYCFRLVKSDGTQFASYAQVPEMIIGTPSAGVSLDQQVRGGQSVVNGLKGAFLF